MPKFTIRCALDLYFGALIRLVINSFTGHSIPVSLEQLKRSGKAQHITCESVTSLVRQVFDSIYYCIFCTEAIQVPLNPWIAAVLGQS